MRYLVNPSTLSGRVDVPASKSHTVRAAVFATLADGQSVIRNPLDSLDARAAVRTCQGLGAQFTETAEGWTVEGVGARPETPGDIVDVMNSGTTLYIAMMVAGLVDGWTVFTGDEQIRRRPAEALIRSIRDLGGQAFSTRGNGCCPIAIRGPLRGGETTVAALTSQYVTAILMTAPLLDGETILNVRHLNEAPYVQMTLNWLDTLGIHYEGAADLTRFVIPGGQAYPVFDRRTPGDFSTATFFLGAGSVLEGADLILTGLDMNDSQGDKAVIDYLRTMGARIEAEDGALRVRQAPLHGAVLDLNATPDALPMMAVVAALAEGETQLINVPQARVKETDRIAVMAEELTKMGADIEELADGLVIRGGKGLRGASVRGHSDHRVAMALAIAGMAAEGPTAVDTAESVAVTFPTFPDIMQALGADLTIDSAP